MKFIIYSSLTIISLLCCMVLFFPYYKFRYPKTSNANKISFDEPPILLNAFGGSIFFKKVGEPDLNGFIATIFDLIGRGYLKPHYTKSNEISLEISITNKKNLDAFEMDIIFFFQRLSKNNCINLQKLKKEIIRDKNIKLFNKAFLNWRKHFIKTYLINKDNEFFILKNSKNYRLFVYLSFLFSITLFCATISDPSPLSIYTICASLVLIILSLGSMIISPNISMEWTVCGGNYFVQLHKLKKYLKNSNLMQENPPTSLQIARCISYGIAMGMSNNTFKSLKYLEKEDITRNTAFIFYQRGGYVLLKSIFKDSKYDAGMESLNFMQKVLKDAGIR